MAITHTHTNAASDRHYSKRVCLCSRLSKWKSHLGGIVIYICWPGRTFRLKRVCLQIFAVIGLHVRLNSSFYVSQSLSKNRCDLRIECVCKWFENVKSSSFTHAHPLNPKLLTLLFLLPIRNYSHTMPTHYTGLNALDGNTTRTKTNPKYIIQCIHFRFEEQNVNK